MVALKHTPIHYRIFRTSTSECGDCENMETFTNGARVSDMGQCYNVCYWLEVWVGFSFIQATNVIFQSSQDIFPLVSCKRAKNSFIPGLLVEGGKKWSYTMQSYDFHQRNLAGKNLFCWPYSSSLFSDVLLSQWSDTKLIVLTSRSVGHRKK